MDGLCWLPDGRLLYLSREDNESRLSLINADGTGQKPLLAEEHSITRLSLSADGRYLVFGSNRSGAAAVWRMEVASGDLKELVKGVQPHCSPDGRWVVYSSTTSGGPSSLHKIGIDGGASVQLETKQSGHPAVSPDSKLIAYTFYDEAKHNYKVAIMSIEGGAPVKVFDTPVDAGRNTYWTPDGKMLSYLEANNNATNLWGQPLDGSPPQQLTFFSSDRISFWDWTRDGKTLACARLLYTFEILLMRDR
jgi:Tol biopolymer transport system component